MRFRHLLIPLCFVISPTIIGCHPGTKHEETSETKWGHLDRSWLQSSLVALPPESRVSTCGKHAKLAAESARQWAQAIGRSDHLKIDDECRSGSRLIRTYGEEESANTGPCRQGAAGYTDGANIHVCRDSHSDTVLTHIILHEVGHIWGLCDQYGDASNCDPNAKGPQDPYSVMGAARGLTSLTSDDKTGIARLSERPDLPNASRWKNLSGSSGNSGQSGSNSNSGSNGTGGSNSTGGSSGIDSSSGSGEKCSCSRVLLTGQCTVVSPNGPKAWTAGTDDLECQTTCSENGVLSSYLKSCNAEFSNFNGNGSTSSGSSLSSDSAANRCQAAGGKPITLSGGASACQCPGMIYRDDAVMFYSREDFTQRCKGN